MKWALIYLLSAHDAGTVLWDTGFRYSSYDECTQQGISIEEFLIPKLDLQKRPFGGRRHDTAFQWRCVVSKD